MKYKVILQTDKKTGEKNYKIKIRIMGIWFPYWEHKSETYWKDGPWDPGLKTISGFYWVNYSIKEDAIEKMELISTKDEIILTS